MDNQLKNMTQKITTKITSFCINPEHIFYLDKLKSKKLK